MWTSWSMQKEMAPKTCKLTQWKECILPAEEADPNDPDNVWNKDSQDEEFLSMICCPVRHVHQHLQAMEFHRRAPQ